MPLVRGTSAGDTKSSPPGASASIQLRQHLAHQLRREVDEDVAAEDGVRSPCAGGTSTARLWRRKSTVRRTCGTTESCASRAREEAPLQLRLDAAQRPGPVGALARTLQRPARTRRWPARGSAPPAARREQRHRDAVGLLAARAARAPHVEEGARRARCASRARARRCSGWRKKYVSPMTACSMKLSTAADSRSSSFRRKASGSIPRASAARVSAVSSERRRLRASVRPQAARSTSSTRRASTSSSTALAHEPSDPTSTAEVRSSGRTPSGVRHRPAISPVASQGGPPSRRATRPPARGDSTRSLHAGPPAAPPCARPCRSPGARPAPARGARPGAPPGPPPPPGCPGRRTCPHMRGGAPGSGSISTSRTTSCTESRGQQRAGARRLHGEVQPRQAQLARQRTQLTAQPGLLGLQRAQPLLHGGRRTCAFHGMLWGCRPSARPACPAPEAPDARNVVRTGREPSMRGRDLHPPTRLSRVGTPPGAPSTWLRTRSQGVRSPGIVV